jgi:hypothetical protein
MAELIVDNQDLVVRLTLGEKIWGFHGDVRARLSSIVSVAPDPQPWLGLRGWRMAGVSLGGHAMGTRRHGTGYDFCILRGARPAVRVDLASGRFSRLVICVPEGGDPEAEAARIAAAAGITPSAPPRPGIGSNQGTLPEGLVVAMAVEKQWVIDTLRRAGYAHEADEAARVLPDPVEADELSKFGDQYGISMAELTSRMGGSP